MKITDWAIIVCLLFVPFSLAVDIPQRHLIEADSIKMKYNNILEIATEDATLSLIKNEDKFENVVFEGYEKSISQVEPNLNKAVDSFYKTLYLNLGIENDKIAQDAIKVYIPLKIAVTNEGIYVHAWQDVFNTYMGKDETIEDWSQIKPYSYLDERNNIIIDFTLDDKVYIYNCNTGNREGGTRTKFLTSYPSSIFNESNFESIKTQTIVSTIRRELEFYTYKYNYIAKQSGKKGYTFNIPVISNDEWQSTIKNTCFIAFLQGFQIGNENYNTYGFGGTKIIKAQKYYGSDKLYNGLKFYHIDSCSINSGKLEVFNSRRDAAKSGYLPCPSCSP